MEWRDEAARHNAEDGLSTSEFAGAIDLEHLSRHTLGNHLLRHEVLALFRTRSQLHLQHLQDASSARAWTEAAHTLKGSARTIGAMGVARCAEAAEQLSEDEYDAWRGNALRELRGLVDEANRFIDGMLADSKPGA